MLHRNVALYNIIVVRLRYLLAILLLLPGTAITLLIFTHTYTYIYYIIYI